MAVNPKSQDSKIAMHFVCEMKVVAAQGRRDEERKQKLAMWRVQGFVPKKGKK